VQSENHRASVERQDPTSRVSLTHFHTGVEIFLLTGHKIVNVAPSGIESFFISPATIFLPQAHMSPSSKTKSAARNTEPFSLVPYAVQRRLYECVLRAMLVREYLGLQDRVHTDFAEIGAVAALLDTDLVFPAAHSIGARVVRSSDLTTVEAELALAHNAHAHTLAQVSPANNSAAETMLTTIVSQLLSDPKRLAVVPSIELAEPAWQNVLRFAGRHRLPILFIVPGRIAGRRDSTDLRTIYAQFGVPVMTIDASDPIAAYRVATEAAHNARAGRGATVLEAAAVETRNTDINSQPPLEHLEEYMRRKGSWDDNWRAEIEQSAREAMKRELSA
jgi:hypothetical protein